MHLTDVSAIRAKSQKMVKELGHTLNAQKMSLYYDLIQGFECQHLINVDFL